MSEKNVELTYRVYDAFARRNLDALLALMDDDVEAVPMLVAMEGGYRGHAGIRRWWENLLDVFPDYTGQVVEVRDLGQFTLGVLGVRAHGRGSDTPFEDTIWQLLEWRNEKVVRWQVFLTEAEAFGAAGLRESELVRAVRSVYEEGNRAWNEGDFERAYQALGDDFEYHLAPTWPQSRPLRGRAEVVKFFESFRETFPDARSGPLEFVEVTERRIIVGFPVAGTGRASGVRSEMEIWQVWELAQGGMPVRVVEYPDRDGALRAAGVTR
jgi:ketosteroid isomerase-like protein